MTTDIDIWDNPNDQLDLFDGDKFREGYSLPGYTEVEKSFLIGVPHVITRATFWYPQKGMGHVSLECVVGTARMLERQLQREKIEVLGSDHMPLVDPEERVVYSDGSTGVRRQIVKLFQQFELVDVGHADMAEDGALGESRYDLPWLEWESFSGSRRQGEHNVPSIEEAHNGRPLRIKVGAGLTASRYENQFGDGITYFLKG